MLHSVPAELLTHLPDELHTTTGPPVRPGISEDTVLTVLIFFSESVLFFPYSVIFFPSTTRSKLYTTNTPQIKYF